MVAFLDEHKIKFYGLSLREHKVAEVVIRNVLEIHSEKEDRT